MKFRTNRKRLYIVFQILWLSALVWIKSDVIWGICVFAFLSILIQLFGYYFDEN